MSAANVVLADAAATAAMERRMTRREPWADMQSAAKFTPGPWGTYFHPSHGHCVMQVNEHGNPKSNDIAVVFMAGNGRTREQCKADARLIAAAPEMLEALQMAKHIVANEGTDEQMAQVFAALEKATGSAA